MTRRGFLAGLSAALAAVVGVPRRVLGRNIQPVPAPIYARAGEVVTCENGHEIATVAQDIYRSSAVRAGAFHWKIEPSPKAGAPMRPCQCGAKYVDNAGNHSGRHGAWALHLADGGWRVTPRRVA